MGRGRPKSNKLLLTAKERADKSLKSLIVSGGRRFNLRLSKEGSEALKTIIEKDRFKDETAAINKTLIAREKQLKKKLPKVDE